MKSIKVSGKNVNEALTEALIQLGVTSDKVDYEVVEKGSAGFLGLGAKKAVINVWLKEDAAPAKNIQEEIKKQVAEDKAEKEQILKTTAQEQASKAEAKEKKESVKKETAKKETVKKEKVEEKPVEKEAEPKKEEKISPEEAEKIEACVKTFLEDVFKAMNMPVEMTIKMDEHTRTLNVNIEGQDMGLLIGKRGQTLDSLQYLISLVANKESNEYIRVKLDTENYRRRRKATLENLAKNIAYKVKRDRKAVVLEPMNPYERRIIHSALQNDRFVETHSEGTEPYRHIVVSLKKNNNNN